MYIHSGESNGCKSLSARRVWIEMSWTLKFPFLNSSLSARRVWIEMIIEITNEKEF